MSRFNSAGTKNINGKGFTGTIDQQVINHNGGTGYLRDEKSDLFLSTVSTFLEDAFYESGEQRIKRISDLAGKVAINDPTWFENFVTWLRGDGNIRSAAIVVALQGAKAMIESGIPGGRKVVSAALQRADEPGEALAYWRSEVSRKVPSAVKRGIADAAVRLYDEYSYSKYGKKSAAYTMADVIRLTHPKPKDAHQSTLFDYIIGVSLNSSKEIDPSLTMLTARAELMQKESLKGASTEELKSAGLTWEAVAGKDGLSAETWEALIPTMGYMALLRNLRNFREYGVSDSGFKKALSRIEDKDQVVKSKQLPFRFLSAYSQLRDDLKTSVVLEEALNHSLQNITSLPGKTLIMIDDSYSMHPYSTHPYGSLGNNHKATLFGTAIGIRAEDADVYWYGDGYTKINLKNGDSILPKSLNTPGHGGTSTAETLEKLYKKDKYDRVIIITDEQYNGGYYKISDPSEAIPKSTPLYIWNVAGYSVGGYTGKNRYTFGGLTDQSFKMIPLLESGSDATWPWVDTDYEV